MVLIENAMLVYNSFYNQFTMDSIDLKYYSVHLTNA